MGSQGTITSILKNTVVDLGGGAYAFRTQDGSITSITQKQVIDEFSATITYVGVAPVGSLTSQSVWFIKKIETVGTITTITYANAGTSDQVFDDRASLIYS